jgi:hypothetical protein
MGLFPAAVHHRNRRSTLGRILQLFVLDRGSKAYNLMVKNAQTVQLGTERNMSGLH